VAFSLAWFGRADGSNVRPTDPRFLASVDLSERQAMGVHIARLRTLGLLQLVRRAGGRTGRPHDEYQLCMPLDLSTLPYRLDADYERYTAKAPGAAPLKAIEASKKARLDRKASSGQTQTGPDFDRKTASAENPPRDGFDQKAASGQTPPEGDFDRKTPSGQSPSRPRFHRKASSGQTAPPPVDNPADGAFDRKAASGQTPRARDPDVKPPSGETDFDRKRASLSPEGQHTLTGSALPLPKGLKNPYPSNPTTRVVSLGGDLTSAGPPGHEDPDFPVPEPPTGPADPRGGQGADPDPVEVPVDAAGFQPSDDPAYDQARAVVAGVEPAELGELLANAQAELELELADRAGTYDDGTTPRGDGREIVLRAAAIVRRAERAAAGANRPTDTTTEEGH